MQICSLHTFTNTSHLEWTSYAPVNIQFSNDIIYANDMTLQKLHCLQRYFIIYVLIPSKLARSLTPLCFSCVFVRGIKIGQWETNLYFNIPPSPLLCFCSKAELQFLFWEDFYFNFIYLYFYGLNVNFNLWNYLQKDRLIAPTNTVIKREERKKLRE